jgi:DNA polymerase-3 subunit alpha (Gram-positive type)
MAKICIVYDIETTGFSPKTHEITQLAAQKVYRNEKGEVVVLDKFNRYCKTNRPVPKEVTDLTGISDEMLAEKGIPVAQAMEEFEKFIGAGTTLVAHNGKRFDSKFIKNNMEEAGIVYDHTELDTLLIAKTLWPKRKHSLGELVADFGLSQKEAHRADEDVSMTVELLALEMRLLEENPDKLFVQACLANSTFNTLHPSKK